MAAVQLLTRSHIVCINRFVMYYMIMSCCCQTINKIPLHTINHTHQDILFIYMDTVKPLMRDHPIGPWEVVLWDRWCFIRDTNVQKFRFILPQFSGLSLKVGHSLQWSLITVVSHLQVSLYMIMRSSCQTINKILAHTIRQPHLRPPPGAPHPDIYSKNTPMFTIQ